MIGGVIGAAGRTPGVLAAGDDQQKAAPLGLFVLLLIGVACYFLFKSMSRHLKRVREDFPEPGRTIGPGAERTAADRVVTDPVTRDRGSTDLGIERGRPIPPDAP